MKKIIFELPLYMVMFVPLIVYGKLFNTGIEGFAWFPDNAEAFDIFLYYKRNAIIIILCLILLFIVIRFFKKNVFTVDINAAGMNVFLFPAVYVLLVFVSSLTSEYRTFAFNGIMEQFEDVWVICGYFLICIYAYMVSDIDIFPVFGVFSAIIGTIGTLQMFGLDIYRLEFVQRMCLPEYLHSKKLNITVEKGWTYCSLSNPNYVGMLCCLTIPILIVLTFSEKKHFKKILYGISVVLMMYSLIGSRSKSGMVITAITILFMLVIFRKQIFDCVKYMAKYKIVIIVIMMLVLCIGTIVLLYKGNYFSKIISSLIKANAPPETEIGEILTNDTNVRITYRDKVLVFSINYTEDTLEDSICITDENGKKYRTYANEGILHFYDDLLANITVTRVEQNGYIALKIWDGTFYWYFTNQTEDGTWCYITNFGKLDKLVSGDIDVFKYLEGKETIVTGRGYIWSRTIPLLKNNILLGSGQESFMLVFPNNDYLGMMKWRFKGMVISKPHCMYMQIAVQSGVLSLIVFIAFMICFFIKIFKNSSDDIDSILAKAIAVGVIGYLIAGISNDSNVGVAPLFWMFIGISLKLAKTGFTPKKP